jgi:hypothetical protein
VPEPFIGNGVRGSHHGLAATAAHSREAGYIYATGIVVGDVANPCTDGADHTFFPRRSFNAELSDDLLFGEPAALHLWSLSWGQSLLQTGLSQEGNVRLPRQYEGGNILNVSDDEVSQDDRQSDGNLYLRSLRYHDRHRCCSNRLDYEADPREAEDDICAGVQ